MAENFPNLVKETGIQFQEAQTAPNRMNSKRLTPKYIIIKMPKVKSTRIFFNFKVRKTFS